MCPIPFEQREFGMMERAPLAISEHAGKVNDPLLPRRQQLFQRELR